MSFAEAGQGKVVLVVDSAANALVVQEIAVPVFQPLATLRGDWPTLTSELAGLKRDKAAVWLEIIYEGDEVIGDLQERLRELVEESALEILRAKNLRLAERSLSRMAVEETLEDLRVDEVFARCLAAHNVPDSQHDELVTTFRSAVLALHGDDKGAE